MSQCPVCERSISARFLCSECDTVCVDSLNPAKSREFYLSLKGTPVPGCCACSCSESEELLDHDCETFQTSFNTSRTICPFCDEKIAAPLSFPASVASFLSRYDGDKIEVSFDRESRQLIKANPGDFVLLSSQTLPAHIVLPNRTEFSSEEEFLDHYDNYYDCDGPFTGEVFVLYPAIVKKEGKGWSLQEVGRLHVEPHETAPADTVEEETNIHVTQPDPVETSLPTCPGCGVIAQPHHRFCKKCGTSLLDSAWSVDIEENLPVSSATTVNRKLLIGVVAIVLLGGLLMLSFGIGRNSTEQRLKDAIARGNLITPPNESAYDYYKKLQREEASAATLSAYRDELLPLLLQRPQVLLDQVTVPRGSDGSLAEWDESQKLLGWAIELSPQDTKLAAKAAYVDGRLAYLRNRPDDALSAYQRAAKLDPEWATPLNSIGALLNERRRYAESRPYLLEAIRRKPDWALPYNNLGTSFLFENRIFEARVSYEKAKDLAPLWARPHAWLGSVALKQKDYCTAARELDQALQLATPNMTNWNAQRIQNDLETARTACAVTPE